MRNYGKVLPRFWTGETGKKIRQHGHQTLVVAAYLMTCPSASWLGVYYLPMPVLCHETASPLEGASEALRMLSEEGFAYYDEVTECVWLPEMARIQIGPSLKPGDNNITGIKRDLEHIHNTPFYNAFLDRYAEAYHLQDVPRNEVPPKPLQGPSGAPSKPRTRSGAGSRAGTGAGTALPSAEAAHPTATRSRRNGDAPTNAVWRAYCVAYKFRYKTEPVRNATINGQLARFLARVPMDEAPMIAAAYVGNSNQTYVRAGHSVGMLLRDAEKLRTEWVTGERVTEAKARDLDHLQTQGDDWKDLIEKAEGQHAAEAES
jgi:hypothetical protein